MRFRVDILGSEGVVAKLKFAGKQLPKATAVGAYNLGLAILAPAVRNAPKKWGVLRGSGHVTLPKGTACSVGFGGPASAYAMVQHERLDYRHKEGGAKYLERAVDAVRPRAADIFLDALRRALEGKTLTISPAAPSNPNQGPRPPASRGRGARRRRGR